MAETRPLQFDDTEMREAMERAYREAVATYGPRTTEDQVQRIFIRIMFEDNNWV